MSVRVRVSRNVSGGPLFAVFYALVIFPIIVLVKVAVYVAVAIALLVRHLWRSR